MADDTRYDASSSILVGEKIWILVGQGLGTRRKTGILPLHLYNQEAWTLYLITPADLGGVGHYHTIYCVSLSDS